MVAGLKAHAIDLLLGYLLVAACALIVFGVWLDRRLPK